MGLDYSTMLVLDSWSNHMRVSLLDMGLDYYTSMFVRDILLVGWLYGCTRQVVGFAVVDTGLDYHTSMFVLDTWLYLQ